MAETLNVVLVETERWLVVTAVEKEVVMKAWEKEESGWRR